MFREYLKLKKYLKLPWTYFIDGMVFMVFSVVTNGISLSAVVPLMDRIFSQKNITLPASLPVFIHSRIEGLVNLLNALAPMVVLKYFIFFIIGIIFLKGIFFYLQNYFLKFFAMRILTDLRGKIYSKVVNLSLDFFTRGRTGEITTRIIYDVGILDNALSESFPKLIFKSLESIVYLTIIFMIDWKLSLICLLLFPLLLLPVFNVGKKLRKLGKKSQESYGKIGNVIQETVYGQKIIKAFNQQKNIIEKFEKENENIFKTIMAIMKRTIAITPFTEIMATIGASGLIYYGGMKVIKGELSPGFLFLFLAGLFSLISPLKTIGTAHANLKQASSALPRIFSILKEKITVRDTGKKLFEGMNEKIEFRNVNFSYGEKKILQDVSFTVKKGEKIGIVGPTGTGKTTLMGLLLRFYDPETGKILVDNSEDIRKFTLDSLREKIGLVTQEPILFYDTVRKNISLKENGNPDEIKEAAGIACIDNFVESLPDKYETIIGERGTTLSGGQKQLLTIARAIYKKPSILILDEATASLDSNSEKLLQKALEQIIKDRTVFIIAHRLSTLKNVDRIIVFKDSRIVEEGTHQQLFDKKGVYYNLWQLQF